MKRIPTNVSGIFSHQSDGISNADIAFSPVYNLSHVLNFTTDDVGNLEDVILPPDEYFFTFSYYEDGVTYYAEGDVKINIGESQIDLGVIEAERKYDVSGVVTLDGLGEDGFVIFRAVDNLENVTTFEATAFGGYQGSLYSGNYFVTFQDGLAGKHYSFGGLLNLNSPKEYNLSLKDEGFLNGESIDNLAENSE